MKLLELKGVNKGYGKHTVLHDVNVTIEDGDVLGVIGQSGSGKTTLLNLIAGFVEPSTGMISYYSPAHESGRDFNKNLHKLKKYLGYTPQHNSFYPKLTVMENLLHFGKLYKLDKKVLANNITSLLEFTQLKGHEHKLGEHLSGGQQKRLDISCSLIHKPKILILDEPTSDLDPVLEKEIVHLLQEVNKHGITIVIASHHLDVIEHMCNKVAIVHNGKVDMNGLVDDVRKPFLRDHFTIHLKPGDDKDTIVNEIRKLPIKKIIDKGKNLVVYPENVEKTVTDLLGIIKEHELFLHDMHLKKPSLNEVFENIVKT